MCCLKCFFMFFPFWSTLAQNPWLECLGRKICSRGSRHDVVERNLEQCRHLYSYIVGPPATGWVSRSLAWRPLDVEKRGAPFQICHSAAEFFVVGNVQLVGKQLPWDLTVKTGKCRKMTPKSWRHNIYRIFSREGGTWNAFCGLSCRRYGRCFFLTY